MTHFGCVFACVRLHRNPDKIRDSFEWHHIFRVIVWGAHGDVMRQQLFEISDEHSDKQVQ